MRHFYLKVYSARFIITYRYYVYIYCTPYMDKVNPTAPLVTHFCYVHRRSPHRPILPKRSVAAPSKVHYCPKKWILSVNKSPDQLDLLYMLVHWITIENYETGFIKQLLIGCHGIGKWLLKSVLFQIGLNMTSFLLQINNNVKKWTKKNMKGLGKSKFFVRVTWNF